ncbi:MAG: hypothetical protein M3O09_04380 [Acidobacteriota bacterium]|nr:hypothetical protein [Acidobacteriota bacterium]
MTAIPPLTEKLFHRDSRLWAVKGALAITDQGLFAGSNFILNVLLARWLTPAEYGTFSLAYSAFLLFVAFHSAAFVEPMLVFGPGKYHQRLDEYLGILIRSHFLVMLPVSGCIVLGSIIISHSSSTAVGHSFLGLAVAVPFILLMWMLRRAFYVELRPGWAMCGGALYLVVLVVLLFVLKATHTLSTVTALIIMCAASAVTSFLLILLLHPHRNSASGKLDPTEVALSHWRYGRWSIAGAIVSWFPLNIYYLVLPAWAGLAGTAALRALTNLINPGTHVLIALSTLLLPVLVRNRRDGGKRTVNRTMGAALLVFLFSTGTFSCGVWLFRARIFHLLYSGKYQEIGVRPLLFLLLGLLATCFWAVFGAGLMALERPDLNFWSNVGATTTAVAIGLPLTALRGVEGAAEGLFLSAVVTAGLMYFFYRRAEFRDLHVLSSPGSEAYLVEGARPPASRGL